MLIFRKLRCAFQKPNSYGKFSTDLTIRENTNFLLRKL
jgi:hypothetical protein